MDEPDIAMVQQLHYVAGPGMLHAMPNGEYPSAISRMGPSGGTRPTEPSLVHDGVPDMAEPPDLSTPHSERMGRGQALHADAEHKHQGNQRCSCTVHRPYQRLS